MRQRLEESTTEAQTLLSGYLRARVEMAELRPHASDVVARMLLYTVVMWRLSDVPLAQLRDAVAVLLSGLVLEQAPRRCLPARGYEAAPARGRPAPPRKGLATKVFRGELRRRQAGRSCCRRRQKSSVMSPLVSSAFTTPDCVTDEPEDSDVKSS